MYRYTVMALYTAVAFIVIYILLDLLFKDPIDWTTVICEGVAFGLVLTGIQYFKERKKQQ